MMAGRAVIVPCPISAAGDTMVTVPSFAMVSQTFGAVSRLRARVADEFDVSGLPPMAKAKVNPAAAAQEIASADLVFMAQPSRDARWIALMMPR